MGTEGSLADDAARSARAAVAMLTLQLRTARREADEAEMAANGWDLETALAQLRARMEPLVEQRQAVLDAELQAVREDCAQRIALAHAEVRARAERADTERAKARRMAAERLQAERAAAARLETDRVGEVRAEPAHPEATRPVTERTQARIAPVAGNHADVWLDDWWSDAPAPGEAVLARDHDVRAIPVTEHVSADDVFVRHDRRSEPVRPERVIDADIAGEPTVASASDRERPPVATSRPRPAPAAPHLPAFPPPTSNDGPITIVIDAESFAKALSAAMAAVLDERMMRLTAAAPPQPWGYQLPAGGHQPPWVPVDPAAGAPQAGYWMHPGAWPPYNAQPPAPPTRKSFWADTWHADVILSVLAMVIVIVVLIAWST